MPRKIDRQREIDNRPTRPVSTGEIVSSTANVAAPAAPTQAGPTNLAIASNVLMFSAVSPKALIGLTWEPAVGLQAATHLIEAATDSGFTAGIVRLTAIAGQFSASIELPTNTLYYFRVRAATQFSVSSWSNVVSVTTTNDTTAPAVPTALAAVFNANGDLEISWTNPTSANFRDVEVSIYGDSGFTVLLYREYSAAQRIVWTASQNRQAGSGTPDVAVFVRMASRSWAGVLSTTAVPTTQPVKAVPANVSGLTQSWSSDAGTAAADLVITWNAASGASYYQLSIDSVVRNVFGTRFVYNVDQNRVEHSGTPDPVLSLSLVGVDGLDQISATPATVTATNAAPAAPTGVVATAFFSVIAITIGSALPADGLTYRFRLIQTLPSAADLTWDAVDSLVSREINAAATYQVGVRAVDVFGQAGSETLSSAVVADALTLAELREAARYSDQLATNPNTLKTTLADSILTGSGGSAPSYVADPWIQGSAALAESYYSGVPIYERMDASLFTVTSTANANNYKVSGPYKENEASEILGGKIRLTGGASNSNVRIVIGLVVSGVPQTPLGASNEFTVLAGAAQADYAFTFATPISINSSPFEYYVGTWASADCTIQALQPSSPHLSGITLWRSSTATYSTSGAPPTPTSMTSGGTTANRELAMWFEVRPTTLAQTTGLTTAVSGTTITLNWATTANAQRYRIERDTGSGFVAIAKVLTTSYVDRGLPASTTCTYRVMPERRNVAGTYSATSSKTTGSGTTSYPVLLAGAWTGGNYHPLNVNSNFFLPYADNGGVQRTPYTTAEEDLRGGTNVNWNQIQATSNSATFNWTLIDDALNDAESRGRRVGICVRMFVPGAGNVCPPFITSGMGTTYPNSDFVPTWNNSTVRSTWRAFVLALGARYDGDPRVAYVYGGQGQYGERIHTVVAGTDYTPSAPSAATAQDYDQDFVDAFPNTTILLSTGGSESRDAWNLFMRTVGRVAYRSNANGQLSAFRNVYVNSDYQARTAIRDKYLTAPPRVEFVASPTATEYDVAAGDMSHAVGGISVRYASHSEINLPNPSGYGGMTAGEKADIDTIAQSVGFRLRCGAVQVPNVITSGVAFPITSVWELSGRVKIYDGYTIRWQLRSGNTIIAEDPSTLDPRNIPLLTSGNGITHQEDIQFSAPNGTYVFGVQVLPPTGDPSGPLKLAQSGLQTSTWYSLGSVTIGGAGASGSAITYPSNAGWVNWIRFVRDLRDRYRTVTLAMAASAGINTWYLRTSIDGSTWRYWAGPVTLGRIISSVADQAAAQAAAIDSTVLGNSNASRVDFPSTDEARYVELWIRNTTGDTVVAEFYPRRLIETDDLAAGAVRAINILAGSITADKLTVAQLSAISGNLGTITAGILTGATIQTAASGARIELTSANGLRSFDASNVLQSQIRTTDGKFIAGTVEIGADGIYLPTDTIGLPSGARLRTFVGGAVYAFQSAGEKSLRLESVTNDATRQSRVSLRAGISAVATSLNLITTGAGTTLIDMNTATVNVNNGGVNVGTATGAAAGEVRTSSNIFAGGTPANTGFRVGAVVASAKATTAYNGGLNISSSDASNALSLFIALQTHATAGSRYAAIEVDEGGTKRELQLQPFGGGLRLAASGASIGFYGTTPGGKPTVTGSRGGNAALASLLTALANLGLLTDSST